MLLVQITDKMCLIYSLTFKDCLHVHHWVIEQHEPAIYCSDVRIKHQGESKDIKLCAPCSNEARESVKCNGSTNVGKDASSVRETQREERRVQESGE